MSIRDRGMKKWHGFFMPEHTGELKNIWHEDKKIKMPILDEYQIQECEEILRYAAEHRLLVAIEVYVDGFIETKIGYIRSMDQLGRNISLYDVNEEIIILHFDEITKVNTI